MATGLLLLGATCLAWAGDFELDGFGTLSAYRGDDATVAVKPRNIALGTSRDGQWRLDGDSVLSLQARWSPSDSLRVVWQVQASDEVGYRFQPRTEWLYLGWTLSPAWSLRLGRQPLSPLEHVVTRNVGFTRVTVRPVATVYSLTAVAPVDGANLSWNTALGSGTLRLDLGGGKFAIQTTSGKISGSAIALGARWQLGPVTLRGGAAETRLTYRTRR